MGLRAGVLFADDVGPVLGLIAHALDVAGDDQIGDFGSEEGFAGADGIDGGDEVAHGVALEDVAERAGIDDLLDHFRRVVHGKHEDLGAGAAGDDFASGFEPVEFGHADVEHGDVRIEEKNFVDGVFSVAGFADYRPTEL